MSLNIALPAPLAPLLSHSLAFSKSFTAPPSLNRHLLNFREARGANEGEWVLGCLCSVADTSLSCGDDNNHYTIAAVSWALSMCQVCTGLTDLCSSSNFILPSQLNEGIFSSVAQLCLTLCDPMNCSMPGLPVDHQFLEFTQTHVHWVGDAIQLSHPLSSPSPPAFNLSQHQGLSQHVGSSHQVAKALEFKLQHQSFQWIFRTDFL